MTRDEAFEKYFRLAAFVQAYDGYAVSIKTWGVTLTGGALGIGFTQNVSSSPTFQALVFLMACILGLSFWFTEVHFKLLQLAHVYRLSSLEALLASDVERIPGPAFLSSFSQSKALDRSRRRWRQVLLFPHVLIPHAPLASVSAGAGKGDRFIF